MSTNKPRFGPLVLEISSKNSEKIFVKFQIFNAKTVAKMMNQKERQFGDECIRAPYKPEAYSSSEKDTSDCYRPKLSQIIAV